jgi:hypothetical protein
MFRGKGSLLFEQSFVQDLLHYIDVDDIFKIRVVCKGWQRAIDDTQWVWARITYALTRNSPPSRAMACYATFQGLRESQLLDFEQVAESRSHICLSIMVNVLRDFCNMHRGGVYIVWNPATNLKHMASAMDFRSFYLTLRTQDGDWDFYFLHGHSILWRRVSPGHTNWATVSLEELLAPYRRSLQRCHVQQYRANV